MSGFGPYGGPSWFFQEGRTTVDLDSADGFAPVNDAGSTLTWPTSAALATEAVSSSTDDVGVSGSEGTGARTLVVQGLSATLEYVEQTVILNGTTSVDLTTPLRRVLTQRVATAGSGDENAGTIDIRLADDTVVARMLIGDNYTSLGFFTIPEGTGMRLLAFGGSLNAVDAVTPAISVRLRIKRELGDISELVATFGMEGALEQVPVRREFKDFRLPPRTDVYIEVDTDTDNTLFHGFLEFEKIAG